MEAGSEGERKKHPEGESKSKRKMKTASQLEILEKTYAAEQYPSEASRTELSVQLGLSDRQLQMWFCHRRLKDRKGVPVKKPSKDFPLPSTTPGVGGEELAAAEAGNEHASGSSLVTHSFIDSRRVPPRSGVALARIGGDVSSLKRYYEPQQSISELRAIAFLEGQLGEPLREDGPILGMEFDPLPPGAFGAPIGMAVVREQKQPEHSFEAKLWDKPDAKIIKGAPRLLHEYQFLPEQPAVRNDTYERVGPLAASYHYGSPADGSNARTLSLSTGHTFLHANEQVPAGHSFSGQAPGLSLFPHQGRPGHLLTSSFEEHDNILQKQSFPNIDMDVHLDAQPLTTLDNPVERRVTPDDDFARVERKYKSEEARIVREVEAHEKRIRKELEKQDILRRKREEQMRKEMERHDRERRKEEERLLREKQREEERYLREQRRELDRREKYLQKASIRAEKMRQKEELLREKEAARQKAATERAVARRMAKESMEPMDDERLELMELAASSKGLPSMLSLDFETLQNLDVFREELTAFPPKSVRLKRPFSIKPWNDSEENIGKLLMVWKFLINFADVLGLWPFTMDEFIQAFHDYDPRLLGEVHVSLLRSIVKDIEDDARTPATRLGVNQTSAANPGGGHPQIVEGAYTWGFSIWSWQRHLNPLTWPEILRQFALSAGFGPQLKKRVIEPTYLRDDNEDNDGEDIISNLRNGAAVENAVAIMQERGFSSLRRSRHCLTPGTVKFAAFHVLSFEGSKGLTIMEVAEKIQKSGLRDLTTSKTPEASIAAALSRDTKLFERTAPSTYCVRPAYRKDPTDAESILSAARERIRIFKSGFIDGVDDAERDEDSESDIVKDPDVDDLNSDIKSKKDALFSQETNKFRSKVTLVNGKKSDTLVETPGSVPRDFSEGLPPAHSENLDEVKGLGAVGDQSIDVAAVSNDATNLDQEDMDTDDSNFGEPWVQGLLEGEYSSLCVEERLNALVALIGVAIEGNSIRVALEERLEAANALKKQMWAEAQLDKRHMKEEYVVKMHYLTGTGNKTEANSGSLAEVWHSPLVTIGEKTNEMFTGTAFPQDQLSEPRNEMNFNIMPSQGNMQMQGFSNALATAENSRSQLKSLIGHKAEEMYVYRSLPLGQDRRRNRYWRFITSSSSNDPGCGRIFVELDDGRWRIIDCEEDFDTLLASLDVRGIRESHLHAMLQKIETSFKETVRRNLILAKGDSVVANTCKTEDPDISETSTSFAIEIGRNENERSRALKEYRDFEEWMWKECYASPLLCAIKYGNKRCLPLLTVCEHCHQVYCSEDSCCPSCYRTNGTCQSDINFSKHMALFEEQSKADTSRSSQGSISSPPRIRLLKLLISLIEVSIPPEALRPVWTAGYRKSWCTKLYSAVSAEELFQVLTLLERAVKGNYLSSNFETTKELLGSSELLDSAPSYSSFPEAVTVLPWLPRTTAAVALRVLEFDSSISYLLRHKAESQNDEGLMSSSKFAVVKKTQDDGTTEPPHSAGLLQEGNWIDVAVGFAGSRRGQGGRGRGRGRPTVGKSQRSVLSSRLQSAKRSKAVNSGTLGLMLGWKGGSHGRGGRKRGRRCIRSKQKQMNGVVVAADENDGPQEVMFEKLEPGFVMDEWNGTESSRLLVEDGEDASSSGRSVYDDQNGQAIGDECDYLAVNDHTACHSNGKLDDLPEGSEYNMDIDDDEDYNNEGLDDAEDEQVDLDVGRFINADTDDRPIWDNGEQNRYLDDPGLTSPDFSQ